MLSSSVNHVDENGRITDNWDTFIKNVKSGKARKYYSIGDYIPLDLSEHGLINMEILAFNPPLVKSDFSGTPEVFLFGKELLNGSFNVPQSVTPKEFGKDNLLVFMNSTISPLIPEEINQNIESVILARDRTFYCATKFVSLSPDMFIPSGESYLEIGKITTNYIPYVFLKDWSDQRRIRYKADGTGPFHYPVLHSNKGMYSVYSPSGVIGQYGVANYAIPNSLPLGFCL